MTDGWFSAFRLTKPFYDLKPLNSGGALVSPARFLDPHDHTPKPKTLNPKPETLNPKP